jgi:hypothetical protein
MTVLAVYGVFLTLANSGTCEGCGVGPIEPTPISRGSKRPPPTASHGVSLLFEEKNFFETRVIECQKGDSLTWEQAVPGAY